MRVVKSLFCILLFSCNSKSFNLNIYDLTRSWEFAKVENFQLNEKLDFKTHWKKNPNRYSNLPKEKKWQSTQITFLINPKIFQNASRESITFSPNSKISWNLKSGKYLLVGELGSLNHEIKNFSKLKIFSKNKLLKILEINSTYEQTWKIFELEIELEENLTLEWESNQGLLFFGGPRLIPIEAKNQKTNVILIVIDAMKRDTLGCLGLQISVTPNLDELCKNSVVFQKHYSNANWTKPSMISFFYGEYSSNLGIINRGFPVYEYEKKIFYNSRFKGVVNILRKNGYFTKSIMNNVFLLEYTGVGVDLGFHSIEQIGKENEDTEEITRQSLFFLETRNKKEPFFLHINYNTPHAPYIPPKRNLKEVSSILEKSNLIFPNMTKNYFGEIHYTDSEIGKIVDKLKEENLLEETIIVITSDHGDMFSPEHVFEKNGINGNLWGHGQTLYEDEIAIPLMIFLPSKIRNKIIYKEYPYPSSNISLVPTLLGFLNLKDEYKGKGIDYSRFFFGKDFSKEEEIYTEGRMMESLIHYPYKYIRLFPGYTNTHLNGAIPSKDKWEEIYDLEKDPEEKVNLKTNQTLLFQLREKWEQSKLQKNAFHLILPPEEYFGNFFTNGEIYYIQASEDITYNYINRYSINFYKKGHKQAKLVVYTTSPEWKFDWKIFQSGKNIPYKFGKWALPSGLGLEKETKLLIFKHKPNFPNFPLIYNDGFLTSFTNTEKTFQLGEEVQNILRDWGYIHK